MFVTLRARIILLVGLCLTLEPNTLAAVQKEVLIGLALTVFGLVVIWLASRSIVRPLQAMSRPDLPKAAPPNCKPWGTSARTSIRSQRRCTR